MFTIPQTEQEEGITYFLQFLADRGKYNIKIAIEYNYERGTGEFANFGSLSRVSCV
jgi:hypothetical protein